MRKIILVMGLMMFIVLANAQINNPVTWNHTAVKIADKVYELRLTASIDANWHMYAQDAGEGLEPTIINFIPNPLISFNGKVKEVGKLQSSYEKYFKSVSKYYAKDIAFVQKIKVKSQVGTVVKGTISYVVCNDRQCLPPKEVPFSIYVGG
ncbi:MAG: protein-disulfide reductase DsbD domain-containing protein [Ferruginibacter sp.]